MSRRRSGRPGRPRPQARSLAPLILVVEDNRDLREIYSTYFAFKGFRVQEASDGHSAFIQAVESRPDLIVTDLSLPHVDGWEMTRRLKEDHRTAHIPVVACTGHTLGAQVQQALAAGCDAYLVKPCLPEDLLKRVREFLPPQAA